LAPWVHRDLPVVLVDGAADDFIPMWNRLVLTVLKKDVYAENRGQHSRPTELTIRLKSLEVQNQALV
jgi:hypothetical protein